MGGVGGWSETDNRAISVQLNLTGTATGTELGKISIPSLRPLEILEKNSLINQDLMVRVLRSISNDQLLHLISPPPKKKRLNLGFRSPKKKMNVRSTLIETIKQTENEWVVTSS